MTFRKPHRERVSNKKKARPHLFAQRALHAPRYQKEGANTTAKG